MKDELTWDFVTVGSETQLILKGAITEETDFGGALQQTSTSPLVVDFSGVTRINSCGVREWVRFAESLNQRQIMLVLQQCPPSVVTQLSMISNFAGVDGKIRSVLAPYFCEECDVEELCLIDFAQDQGEIQEYRECPRCGGQMEFDDLMEPYEQSRGS